MRIYIRRMKFLPGICWFFITLILLSLPGSAFPKESWADNLQIDKIVHIVLFGTLSYLFFIPYSKTKNDIGTKKRIVIRIAICCLIYGVIMEFVQKYWIPNRSFDIMDIAADGLGSFLPYFFRKKIIK